MKIKLSIERSPWQYEEKEMELSQDVATVLLAAFQEKNWARKVFAQNGVGLLVSAIDPISYKKYTFTLTDDLIKAFNAGEYSLGIACNNSIKLQDALAVVAVKPKSYLNYYRGIQTLANALDNTGNESELNKSLAAISIASNPYATFAASESQVLENQVNDDLQEKMHLVKPSVS